MAQPQQQQNSQASSVAGDYSYTVNKFHNGGEWMLAAIDTHTLALTWTKSSMSALVFYSAEEARDLIGLFDILQGCHVGRILIGN